MRRWSPISLAARTTQPRSFLQELRSIIINEVRGPAPSPSPLTSGLNSTTLIHHVTLTWRVELNGSSGTIGSVENGIGVLRLTGTIAHGSYFIIAKAPDVFRDLAVNVVIQTLPSIAAQAAERP